MPLSASIRLSNTSSSIVRRILFSMTAFTCALTTRSSAWASLIGETISTTVGAVPRRGVISRKLTLASRGESIFVLAEIRRAVNAMGSTMIGKTMIAQTVSTAFLIVEIGPANFLPTHLQNRDQEVPTFHFA